ncbi:DUF3618 domain-containing protein [Naumannella cuiyingiana]|uniref:DUF3618 domain-containing protein n=1 Tax=Naumannella cuiyingiana TaxID=1347891 RepID=A0A7Z0D7D7_9ACTN|nr:hypothetical protein [Naumannella cuiyingiana]
MSDPKQRKAPDPRSVSEIESDIAATEARLSADVEDLVDQVQPGRVKERAFSEAKTFATTEFNKAKQEFVDNYGLRWDRVALIGGAVVGTVVFALVLRGIVKAARRN